MKVNDFADYPPKERAQARAAVAKLRCASEPNQAEQLALAEQAYRIRKKPLLDARILHGPDGRLYMIAGKNQLREVRVGTKADPLLKRRK